MANSSVNPSFTMPTIIQMGPVESDKQINLLMPAPLLTIQDPVKAAAPERDPVIKASSKDDAAIQ
jgi:hypothetical protein